MAALATAAAARWCAVVAADATALAGSGQGEAAATAAGAAAAQVHAVAATAGAGTAVVGLHPRSSLCSHSRGSSLLIFLK